MDVLRGMEGKDGPSAVTRAIKKDYRCLVCDRLIPLMSKGIKFCSPKCKTQFYAKPQDKPCERCGVTFSGTKAAKYCSDCRFARMNESRNLRAKARYERKKNEKNTINT